MSKFIQALTGSYASSARVVDGTLILSLPDALSPIVWRMDLGHVRSSALEVRARDDGTFVLTLKTPRDDIHDIAPFAARGQAVRALMAVSRALENAHGQIRSATAAHSNDDAPVVIGKRGGIGRWIAGGAAVLILLFLGTIMMHQAPATASFGGSDNASPVSNAVAPNVNASGVPVSADDYLRQDKAAK